MVISWKAAHHAVRSETEDSLLTKYVSTQSEVIRRDKVGAAMRGRTRDQFRLSRLKEGERETLGRAKKRAFPVPICAPTWSHSPTRAR